MSSVGLVASVNLEKPENKVADSKKDIKPAEKEKAYKKDNLDIRVFKEGKPINKDPFSYEAPNGNEKNPDIHMFFFSDSHSRIQNVDKFIKIANEKNPDLIIDSGDIVHDATEPEFDKAYADRDRINSPVYMAEGNHDDNFRGPFVKPLPTLPDFQSFDFKGAHFILVDNKDEEISEEQFKKLEADLEKNKGKTTIVSMHVPPVLAKEKPIIKIANKLHLDTASPRMKNPDQVKRFTDLMSKYKVSAVLTGHTHYGDFSEKDGVKYITTGATGGLTPGLGDQNEFIDMHIKGKDVEFKRIQLEAKTYNPLKFIGNTLDFYADLNSFSHEKIGWNYIPSASVQYESGVKFTEKDGDSSVAATITASAERNRTSKSALFATTTLAVGPEDLNGELSFGYKYRIIGDYNKGVFVKGSVGANGGIVVDSFSGGVGAAVGAGVDYKNMTFGLGYELATNYKATTASLGYRF